ncbi:choline dehydrogenase [Stagnimonas aquatica]|uniref:Choline dehydrogenase n=1 Tax=Stagnimonas aquatica TaxID=2689987 RepID=A0A3N0V564_9GAMM|nr:choline dehydrogenase [Stagnimonas aquatica]ROH87909.1 choline dehydrogenase [Stagnimonas aquatica]
MEADYVIVGGGSAGCVLANRLSADGRFQVVLIEAGPPDASPFIHMPAGIIPVIRSDTYNWKYWTAPEPNMGNRPMHWPRGRTLGGSSSINAMCYIRGHAWDYDHWASLGCQGWSYADVLPVFRRLENYEPCAGEPDAYHGVGGPLNVARARYLNPLMHAFVQAAQQAGHPLSADFNGASQEGVGYYDVMQKGGERCSNARAYLEPAKSRANLSILTEAQVTGVRFEGKRAVAVQLRNAPGEVRARREVILSAGAVGSPQLLLLSGIGPAAHLREMEVPLVQALPGVGENLQDHLDIAITVLEKTRHAVSLNPLGLPRSLKALWRYLRHRQGEMTSNFAQAGGFLRSGPEEAIPDVQLHFVPFVYSNHGQDLMPIIRHWGYTLMACDLRPRSRGRISLASRDPLAHPNIEARYLQHDSEMQRLLRALRLGREILAQPAFAPHRGREQMPGDGVLSEAPLREWIRQKAETIYHPVGTCKMGVDDMAVVDLRLKVRGVEGLRVVDASIMPTLIGGNTNAPTTMIAEKGADAILADAA